MSSTVYITLITSDSLNHNWSQPCLVLPRFPGPRPAFRRYCKRRKAWRGPGNNPSLVLHVLLVSVLVSQLMRLKWTSCAA